MTEFIEFCNDNQGFISAILSFFTILISIIAVFVSIHASKLPYKKKLKLEYKIVYGVLQGSGDLIPLKYQIEATNLGRVPISLSFIGLAYKASDGTVKRLVNKLSPNAHSRILNVNEVAEVPYELSTEQELSGKDVFVMAMEPNGKIYKQTKRQMKRQARSKI